MKHPRLVRFFIGALQEPNGVRRSDIIRMYDHEHAIRDEKLAELDAERERNAPVLSAYLLAIVTVAVPIAAIIWLLVAR